MLQIQLNAPAKSVMKFFSCGFLGHTATSGYLHLAGLAKNVWTGGASQNSPVSGPLSTPGATIYQVVESAV
jgi:hypothetical protein